MMLLLLYDPIKPLFSMESIKFHLSFFPNALGHVLSINLISLLCFLDLSFLLPKIIQQSLLHDLVG